MMAMLGFDLHRGLLAAADRPAPLRADALLDALPDGPATVLLLEGLTNTDNVGACFRNAAALGAHALLLDDHCCDPLYRKAIRVSAGHALGLPFNNPGEPIDALLDALEGRNFTTAALTLSDRALPLERASRPAPRLALLLGTEGPGLTPRAHQRAHLHLRIPMAPGVDSLNVATAAAVALFALRH
jgi:tRNA G18 (ribose-2'-O)-methylase SpoU